MTDQSSVATKPRSTARCRAPATPNDAWIADVGEFVRRAVFVERFLVIEAADASITRDRRGIDCAMRIIAANLHGPALGAGHAPSPTVFLAWLAEHGASPK